MRIFVSIELPKEIKIELSKIQKKLGSFVYGNYSKPENLHITLKFISHILDINQIKKELINIISEYSKFNILLKGIGTFKRGRFPSIIWVGSDEKKIINIQKEINSSLTKYGVKSDARFGSHITLVRVKRLLNEKKLNEFLDINKDKEFGSFEVNNISLIESKLTPIGPIYSVIEEFNLK